MSQATDSQPPASEEPSPGDPPGPAGPPASGDPSAAPSSEERPLYKGAPLEAEAGPGLGCFWLQVVLLIVLLVLTPLTVVWALPSWVSAALLILTLVILFFVGMTMVFLLRLVAADRRAQRRPLREGARKTVGQLESESAAENAASVDDSDRPASDQDHAGPDQG